MVKFHPAHIDLVNPTEVFLGETTQKIEAIGENDVAFTVMKDDAIMGCIGGQCLENPKKVSIMHIWSIFTKAIYENPQEFAITMHRFLERFEEDKGVDIFQTYVKVGYPLVYRWAQFLKFKEVRIMRKFGLDNSDYYLMVRQKNVFMEKV
jgi:hypothetical protein